MTSHGLDGFEDTVATCMRVGDIPGVVVGIVDRSGIRYTGGFGLGHIGRSTAPDDRSRFCIQSCTKAFLATTVAVLVGRGMLHWDDPIHTLVPEFRLSDPAATKRVSFRDLLAHRTGLPAGHDWMRITAPLAPAELLERLAYLELRPPPREDFEYSNLMYVIGGALVERLTGTPWEQFLRLHILEPLGMSDTALDPLTSEDAPNAMPDYARSGQDWVTFANLWEPKLWRALMSPTNAPCGGVVSTVRDLCTWLRYQLGSRPPARGLPSWPNLSALHAVQVHGPTVIREAETTDGGVGMGWFVQTYRGHRLIAHWGGASGPTVCSFMPDDGLGVCVHSNRAESSFHAVNAIMFSAFDRLLDLEPLPWPQRWSVPMAVARPAPAMQRQSEGQLRGTPGGVDLAGRYAHPGYGSLEVRHEPTGPRLYYQGLRFDLAADGEALKIILTSRVPQVLTGWWGTRQAALARAADGTVESIAIPFEPAVRPIRFVRQGGPHALSSV